MITALGNWKTLSPILSASIWVLVSATRANFGYSGSQTPTHPYMWDPQQFPYSSAIKQTSVLFSGKTTCSHIHMEHTYFTLCRLIKRDVVHRSITLIHSWKNLFFRWNISEILVFLEYRNYFLLKKDKIFVIFIEIFDIFLSKFSW